MKLVAGCYERFIFGFEEPSYPDGTGVLELKSCFTYAAHKSAVKCVASGGRYLASGGSDDLIHLFDVESGRDLGFLMNPGEGAIPCLEFYEAPDALSPSHLFSGSADGSISIWKVGKEWPHLKCMRGHKGSINSIAIHASGKLALSTSRDGRLRMWDLARGRCTYTMATAGDAELVHFTPSGMAYVLLVGGVVTLHEVAGTGALVTQLKHNRRAQAWLQTDDSTALTGHDNGNLCAWDMRTGRIALEMAAAHAARVKGIAALEHGGSALPRSFWSASSDGILKVWDCRMLSADINTIASLGQLPVLAAHCNTQARITCVCTADFKVGRQGTTSLVTGVEKVQARLQHNNEPTAVAGNTEERGKSSGPIRKSSGKHCGLRGDQLTINAAAPEIERDHQSSKPTGGKRRRLNGSGVLHPAASGAATESVTESVRHKEKAGKLQHVQLMPEHGSAGVEVSASAHGSASSSLQLLQRQQRPAGALKSGRNQDKPEANKDDKSEANKDAQPSVSRHERQQDKPGPVTSLQPPRSTHAGKGKLLVPGTVKPRQHRPLKMKRTKVGVPRVGL